MRKSLRKYAVLLPLLGFALGFALQAAGPVPRPAPKFTIHPLSGPDTPLSTQKGHVVVVQFLSTLCGHCQHTAEWLSTMATEWRAKGVRVYGVAFTDEVHTKDPVKDKAALVRFGNFAKFPLGVATAEDVMAFMGLGPTEPWSYPQMVVIDKQGKIRAQTTPEAKPNTILDEAVMRSTIAKLVAEK